ncbi:Polyketide cyclase / dehydrase and lipid transport [Streptomyces sp. DvalAA-14]|uniref:SRPBCC family protein n=1 Tax=unclassified Streptomyces TaxID=2593676 RepID=UPI00081B7EC9|nr:MULTISPECIES: SRPBCC family protein [unclassified Streptomyces]MYS21148.1 polyketide cyclase [Streptomyces sp. SID4948]SCD85363.1 Polyketide cyclase / dehydrase and lipid transport [Streptomyces sp. DvalAA-14]
MAEKKSGSNGGSTGLEELREEVSDFLHGLSQGWVEKAGEKVTDLTDKLTGMAEEKGGAAAAGARILQGENPAKALVGQKAKDTKDKVVGKAKEAIPGMGGGGGDGNEGDSKTTNIMESIDVGVPVRIAYDHWTQLEDFPTFTKGAQDVSKEDDVTSKWTAKIAFSTRNWEATVQEQIPDERIRWTSEGNKGTTSGVVSFHELAPDLTRILVVVEYKPDGFMEKFANLWRAVGRRLRLDLKHFGRHVTMNADEEVEGWRGEIRDGEVVRSHEDALQDDEDDQDDQGEEDSYDEEDDEDEAGAQDADDDEFDDEDEDDEEQEKPAPRRGRASRGPAR